MPGPTSAIRTTEVFARRSVERNKSKSTGPSTAARASAARKVSAVETSGAARRAHVEPRDDAVSARKPSRGKVSVGQVAQARAQRQSAERQAQAAASRQNPSAGGRTANAATASDSAAIERVVRKAAANGEGGPPRPPQDATAPARTARRARRASVGAATPRRARRVPRAASSKAAIQTRNRAEAARRSDAAAPTRASSRARETAKAAVAAAAQSSRSQAPKVETNFSPAAQQAGKAVQRGVRASGTGPITGEKVRFAARVGAEAVNAGVQGLRSASGFTGKALSAHEAGESARAVATAIRSAPHTAIAVATAGLRPE